NSSPGELQSELAGSLDNIVMKALGKEPQRRYGSVHEFSQDINRHLQGLPVAAPAYVTESELETVARTVAPLPMYQPNHSGGDPTTSVQFVIPKKVARRALAISAVAVALVAISAPFFYLRLRASRHNTTAPINRPIRLTNNLSNDTYPKVSPDGAKIVFVSDRTGLNKLFVMNIDGSGLRNLTSDLAQELAPSWAPDGRRIAFEIITTPLRESDIWVMNADGGDPVNLTKTPGIDGRPVFSPDGTRIAFCSNRGASFMYNFDIWVMNADGSNARRLTDYPEYEADATWSPDGKRIAFTRVMPDKQYDIMVINADRANLVNLTNTAKFD